jgi:hypothetical protein
VSSWLAREVEDDEEDDDEKKDALATGGGGGGDGGGFSVSSFSIVAGRRHIIECRLFYGPYLIAGVLLA